MVTPVLYTANDVPGLRHQLVDYYSGPGGCNYFARALALDRQPMRPPGHDLEVAARQLTDAELGRVRDGDLWYVDEDLCDLIDAAFPTMPAFAPEPQDLPSQAAFAVFARPIAVRDSSNDYGLGELTAAMTEHGNADLRRMAATNLESVTKIVAVSWGPSPSWYQPPVWTRGGVWLSFYSDNTEFRAGLPAHIRAKVAGSLPDLTVDNEAGVGWRPDGAPAADYSFPEPDPDPDGGTTIDWARLVFATFQLAAQTNLSDIAVRRPGRAERRRAERAGLEERDVHVVKLRASLTAERDSEPGAEGTREWRHRWVVRGHWRNQWYPSKDDHRPKWIAPYLKGPTDAPLLGGERVNTATAPNPRP
jgi:hypothetical protein